MSEGFGEWRPRFEPRENWYPLRPWLTPRVMTTIKHPTRFLSPAKVPPPMKLFAAASLLILSATPALAAEIDFAHEIAPLLKQHCGKCHLGEQEKGGLSFNTRETLLAGGDSGKVVSPGKSATSDLIERLKS